mgnify:CR=1 FL=1
MKIVYKKLEEINAGYKLVCQSHFSLMIITNNTSKLIFVLYNVIYNTKCFSDSLFFYSLLTCVDETINYNFGDSME